MSVQAGIWNFDGHPVDHKLVSGFSDSLSQRGPHGESTYVNDSIAFLYRPFHTTAESRREKQPYHSQRGFILTWDGRLDSRNELMTELGADIGPDRTDVAIVAAAFERWQTDSFRRIIGDWAVSIWKPEERELLLAADYMAIRHIFYYLKKQCIWWSTDLTPLVLLSGDRFQIDENYIAGYFAHDPEAHLTPYQGVREVPPGQFVRFRDGAISIERYWRFNPKSRIRYKTDTEYEEHFRHIFRQSVRRRLRSDSPILAELSGGLDSSSIVCMADNILNQEGAQTPRLDTLSFYDKTEPNGDDWLYFPKVEEQRGRVGAHIDVSTFGSEPTSLEYPNFHALPTHLGSGRHLEAERAAIVNSGGYRVVLSGLGGDEFMGGIPNPSHQLADLILRFKAIELAKQLMAWSLVKRRPCIQLLWQAFLELLPASLSQYLVKQARIEEWIERDFARHTKIAIRQLDVDEHFGLWLPSRRSYIAGVMLMGNKLAKVTPSALALEEARYPYLDQHLIEFMLSIPATQLLRPNERRSLMRRALAGIVPPEILARRTKQFGARTPILSVGESWEELCSVFSTALSSRLGFIRQERFLQKLHAARNGKTVHIVRMLRTISLEYWLRDLVARGLLSSKAIPPSALNLEAFHVKA